MKVFAYLEFLINTAYRSDVLPKQKHEWSPTYPIYSIDICTVL